jgi:monoterpene epsilon-lactone hydrolase
MQTFVRALLSGSLRLLLKPAFSGWMPIGIQRFWLRVMSASSLPPRGTRAEVVDMGGVSAERVTTPQSGERVVLYLHGGGYCVGSCATHRALAARIARAAGATCYVPEYQLAPEHPHPAALDDALVAYRWLLSQNLKPAQIAIGGDSAGGGLAVATALAIRDAGLPQPAALVLISPWVDLTLSGDSIKTRAARDPMLSHSIGALWSRLYLGTHAANHPLCSPLFSNLAGLPPMLIQVGSEEILLSDSQRLEQRAKTSGVEAQAHLYDRMWHDFQVHAGVLHEADAAIAEIGEFVKQHVTA